MTAITPSRHKGFAAKRFGAWILAFIMAGIGYLAFWPVAIDPIIWDPPANRAYEGVYAPNTALASLEPIALNGYEGPEDAVLWQDHIFTAVSSGDILKIDPKTLHITPFANTGGRPLGLEVNPANNHLIIADAYKGLMSLSPDGALTLLSDNADGRAILYADDVDIAPDGVIYFSDASTKFGAQDNGGTLAASLLELMERRATGRLLAYSPDTGTSRLIARGFSFANGVAMHPDGDILLLETGGYSLYKINPNTGAVKTLLSNLPGFPDNINPGPRLENGKASYFIGLVAPRSPWLDDNAARPAMRRFAMRLPPFMRPQAVPYVHIVHMDEDGQILASLQDPKGGYHDATGAIVADGFIYITSLTETTLARKTYPIQNLSNKRVNRSPD